MSKFVPKLVNDDGRYYCVLDNIFTASEGVEWAAYHNLDIKFTCGNYTDCTRILYKMFMKGYELVPVERIERTVDGTAEIKMYDTVYGYLHRFDEEDDTK